MLDQVGYVVRRCTYRTQSGLFDSEGVTLVHRRGTLKSTEHQRFFFLMCESVSHERLAGAFLL